MQSKSPTSAACCDDLQQMQNPPHTFTLHLSITSSLIGDDTLRNFVACNKCCVQRGAFYICAMLHVTNLLRIRMTHYTRFCCWQQLHATKFPSVSWPYNDGSIIMSYKAQSKLIA